MSAHSGMTFNQRRGIVGTAVKPQQPPHLYAPSRPFGSDIKLANPNYFGVTTLKQVRKGAYRNVYMKNSFQNILRPLAGGGMPFGDCGGMKKGDRGGLAWGGLHPDLRRPILSGINPDGSVMSWDNPYKPRRWKHDALRGDRGGAIDWTQFNFATPCAGAVGYC